MNRENVYFVILILVLCGAGIFAISFSHQINLSYQSSISSWLQAQVLKNTTKQVAHNNELINNKESSIIFVGDIMLSRFIQTQIEQHGDDYNFPFASSSQFLRSADAVFGNFEGVMSDRGIDQGSKYSFRVNPKAVDGLKTANFKIMSLANNHIWDWGKDALLDTVLLLKSNGIEIAGAGNDFDEANKPAILEINNTKVAFFAFTNLYPESLSATETSPGVSTFDATRLKNQINDLKTNKKADIVVASFHWGDEYETSANSMQKELAHKIIDAGADLIIGHHPHVIEESEVYKGKYIFYSLGNFIFDQNFSKETMEGLAVKMILENKAIEKIERYNINLNKLYQPYKINLLVD